MLGSTVLFTYINSASEAETVPAMVSNTHSGDRLDLHVFRLESPYVEFQSEVERSSTDQPAIGYWHPQP